MARDAGFTPQGGINLESRPTENNLNQHHQRWYLFKLARDAGFEPAMKDSESFALPLGESRS